MASRITLRPPTPDMQGRELRQWLQRVYDALLELGATSDSVITDHTDLSNIGEYSHSSIDSHIENPIAHGSGSPLVGEDDVPELIIEILTDTPLKHGETVDNPSSNVHGVEGSVVGTTDEQTLSNKRYFHTYNAYDDEVINLPATHEKVLINRAGAYVALPSTLDNAGLTLSIMNASTGNIRVNGAGFKINDEDEQTLPPASCMTIMLQGSEWRII